MWSKVKLEEHSRVLFNSPWVSPELNIRNQEQWVKSVEILGSKWLYHESNNVKRKDTK